MRRRVGRRVQERGVEMETVGIDSRKRMSGAIMLITFMV